MIRRAFTSEVATERGIVVAAGSAEGQIAKLETDGTGTVVGIALENVAAGETQAVAMEGEVPLALLGAACDQFAYLTPMANSTGKLRPIPTDAGDYVIVARALQAGAQNTYIAAQVIPPRTITVAAA